MNKLLKRSLAFIGGGAMLLNLIFPSYEVFAEPIDNPTEDPDCEETNSEEKIVKLEYNDSVLYCKTIWGAAQQAGGNEALITLLKDTIGNGMVVGNGTSNKLIGGGYLNVDQNITIDFSGFTYTIDKTVGSTNTQTNGFQMLKGSKVTLKNGTLESTTASIILQNYNELKLIDMVINGQKNSNVTYAASNNNGSLTVKGSTNIYSSEGEIAFDLWYGMNGNGLYDDGVSVIFDSDFNGIVEGNIEYGPHNRAKDFEDWESKTPLVIGGNGYFNGNIIASNGNDLETANITINGGFFNNKELEKYLGEKCFLPNLDSETKTTYKYKVGNCVSAEGNAEIGTGEQEKNDEIVFEDINEGSEENKSEITASVVFDNEASNTGTVVGIIDDTTHNVEEITISTGAGQSQTLKAIAVAGESTDETSVASDGTTTIKVKNSASKLLGTITMTNTKSSLRIMFETLISKLFTTPTVALRSRSYKVASLKMIKLASLPESGNEKILGQDTLNLSVSPADGYNFSEWKISGIALPDNFNKTANPTTLKLPSSNGAITVSAVFTEKPATVSNGGSGRSKKTSSSSTTTEKKDETKVTTGNNEEITLGGEVTEETTTTGEVKEENTKADVIISDAAKATYNEEQLAAYQWAYENGITTINNADEARLGDPLTRAELAKMMSQYISSVLKKSPIKADLPGYKDVDESLGDLADYIVKAYQYQIMGIDADGNALEYFNPNGLVTRAEYATVFSRVLYGSANNQKDGPYYEKHLAALKEAGILSNDDPTIQEVRGWVMLMMYRSVNPKAPAQEETKAEEGTGNNVGIANPASTYCVEQEGKIEIREDAEGAQYGVCKFKDGTEVEEWEYFRANHKDETTTGAVAESSTGAVAENATGAVATTGAAENN